MAAGPEFAERAFKETLQQCQRLWGCFQGNLPLSEEGCRMTREEFERRMVELYLGCFALRALIPADERLVPPLDLITVH